MHADHVHIIREEKLGSVKTFRAYYSDGRSRYMGEKTRDLLVKKIRQLDPVAVIVDEAKPTKSVKPTTRESQGLIAHAEKSKDSKTRWMAGVVSGRGKYYVILGAAPNTDFGRFTHLGSVHIKPHGVPVPSFEAASKKCQEFIRDNELGGGNWGGAPYYERDRWPGTILDAATGDPVAYVSYNGRVWDSERAVGKEIPILESSPSRMPPTATLKDLAGTATDKASDARMKAKTREQHLAVAKLDGEARDAWRVAQREMEARAKAGVGTDALNKKLLLRFASEYAEMAREHERSQREEKAKAQLGG